jgi:Uncharacterized conserved protein (DUF2203)
MKRNKSTKSRRQIIPVWTYAQARSASPYVASIMRSVRDHQIDAHQHELAAKQFAKAPGRPDRKALIAYADATRESGRARDRLAEALDELHDLGIECLDPIQGTALVPFANEKQLAWFVYDLFDDEPLRFWRLHDDPLDTRRPIETIKEESA